jgi:hypothetical protein
MRQWTIPKLYDKKVMAIEFAIFFFGFTNDIITSTDLERSENMIRILEFLDGQMQTPTLYGWFHLLALAIVVTGATIAAIKLKNISEKKLRVVLIVFSSVLLLFEVYKQLNFSYHSNWDYQWYAFPFQFCSTPMYVGLFAGLTKNARLREALIAFLATYGLFSGAAVMFYPSTVFIQTIGINIQTMVHHGGMAIIGVGLLVNQVKLEPRTLIKAASVFAVTMVMAMAMNQIHNRFIQEGTFNMFFINPLHENGIPVLSLFQPLVSHQMFLLIYFFGFSLCAFIVLGFAILIKQLSRRKAVKPAISSSQTIL